jgi:hypothetical protein
MYGDAAGRVLYWVLASVVMSCGLGRGQRMIGRTSQSVVVGMVTAGQHETATGGCAAGWGATLQSLGRQHNSSMVC